MADIIGCVTTSHVPAIAKAIARGQQDEPYWKPWFDGFEPVHRWLARARPDVAVVIYNDHGLNFFLDALPTFAIGAAAEYRSADEGWNIPTVRPFPGDQPLSWHIINSVVAADFDVTMCQQMVVDHAVCNPMTLLWPGGGEWPVRIVPVEINTVQFPFPSAARCYEFGEAIGRAVAAYPEDLRVVVIGTGGLSHQLDGERAGFINKDFDLFCLEQLIKTPETLTRYTIPQLVELAGSQGVELLNWITMRGVLTGRVSKVHGNYHIPISNTASALLVLDNQAVKQTELRRAG